MKYGRQEAINLAKEAMQDGEWKNISEVLAYVNEKHYKEWTLKGLGMLLSGAVKRLEVEKKRISDAGVRIMLYRIAEDGSGV